MISQWLVLLDTIRYSDSDGYCSNFLPWVDSRRCPLGRNTSSPMASQTASSSRPLFGSTKIRKIRKISWSLPVFPILHDLMAPFWQRLGFEILEILEMLSVSSVSLLQVLFWLERVSLVSLTCQTRTNQNSCDSCASPMDCRCFNNLPKIWFNANWRRYAWAGQERGELLGWPLSEAVS